MSALSVQSTHFFTFLFCNHCNKMPFLTGRAILEGTYIKGMCIMNSIIKGTSIDMNYQPITSVADPESPSDAATRYFVENTVSHAVKTVKVHLTGTSYVSVAHLPPGSYWLSISPTNTSAGGPTASFLVSKNLLVKEAHVTRQTSLPGEGSSEELDLKWGASGPVSLRLTGPHYTGCYSVKIV